MIRVNESGPYCHFAGAMHGETTKALPQATVMCHNMLLLDELSLLHQSSDSWINENGKKRTSPFFLFFSCEGFSYNLTGKQSSGYIQPREFCRNLRGENMNAEHRRIL